MNRVSAPRVPGSEHIPFNPINPWGRKPVVRKADGTPLDWKNPLREPLFQVQVDDALKGCIPIGPKCAMGLADQICSAAKLAIKSGRIHGWTNPHVIPIAPERAVARVF